MLDTLGDRMKNYETVAARTLIARMPVIIRLDGKAFHSYLSNVKKHEAFSMTVNALMTKTMEYLCENIQNVVLGYTQSDEISLLLVDWATHETQQWFGGNQTKMETIAASMATGIFNRIEYGLHDRIRPGRDDFAMFDARAYNVPREDVTNYFVWRQKDAMRNSVSMLAQWHFSHKELHGKSTGDKKQMLIDKHSIRWEEMETWKQRGVCWKKDIGLDYSIPVFKEKDREYVDKTVEWIFKQYVDTAVKA